MKADESTIKQHLFRVGILVNGIYDLVNTRVPYPKAIPILLDLLDLEFDDIRTKEGIVRALAVKEAKGIATPFLIKEYNKTSEEFSSYRWAIGSSVFTTITKNDIEDVWPIVVNKENGMSR